MDIGQPAAYWPMAPAQNVALAFAAQCVSADQALSISNAVQETEFTLSYAKGVSAGTQRLSTKSVYNRERELARILDAGGKFVPSQSLGSSEFMRIYRHLFIKRWDKRPHAIENFPKIIPRLWPLLCGDVLFIKDEPAAAHMLFVVSNPQFNDYNFINSAVDPAFQDLSVGSALIYQNVKHAETQSLAEGKTFHYCFGKSGNPYKKIWCYEQPVFNLSASS